MCRRRRWQSENAPLLALAGWRAARARDKNGRHRERTARRDCRGGAVVDWHAVSQLRRHQGRRRRLRHAVGAGVRRRRLVSRRSIRGPIRSTGICIAARSAISASSSIAAAKSPNPQPGDVMVLRYGRCYSHGGIVTRRRPLTIVHAFHPARRVLEEEIGHNSRAVGRQARAALLQLLGEAKRHERPVRRRRQQTERPRRIIPACKSRPRSTRCRFRSSGANSSSRRTSSGTTTFRSLRGSGKGGGKGGLFGSGSSETTYSAAVIMALCEGPITGINQIWKNQSVYSLSELGLLACSRFG